MKETMLNATYQKSYYGKAAIQDGANGEKLLRSYDTIVCAFNPKSGEVSRFWNGYSVTTQKHINDFRKLYGLAALSKKEWKKIPCANGNSERYKVEFSNGFVNWTAGAIFDNYADAETFAEGVCDMRGGRVWYDIYDC